MEKGDLKVVFVERRRFGRYRVSIPAKVELPGSSFSVSVENISGGGARFVMQPFLAGIIATDPFTLRLPDLGSLPCCIRWRGINQCGVGFRVGDDRKRAIAAELERRFQSIM